MVYGSYKGSIKWHDNCILACSLHGRRKDSETGHTHTFGDTHKCENVSNFTDEGWHTLCTLLWA